MAEKQYKLRTTSTHDFEREPTLEGRIVNMEPIQVGAKFRHSMVIDTGEAMARVFQSKALEEIWTKGELGDMVRLTYGGKKPLSEGRSFSRFSVLLWTDDDSPEHKRLLTKQAATKEKAGAKTTTKRTARRKSR